MAALLFSVKREFMFALVLHICVLLVAIVFGSAFQKRSELLVVDLTAELPGGGKGGLNTGGGSPARDHPKGSARPAAKPENASKKAMTSLSVKRNPVDNTARDIKDQERSSPDKSASEIAANASSVGTGEGGSGGGYGSSSSAGSGGGTGGGTGRGTGTGRGSDSSLRMQYLKEHFSQIRDLIMKHLSYPQMAKKNGWKGRVIVAFIIRENGTVENPRVVRSSGYDILDSNVVKTILDVQPFPKPPIRAELVIPIVYKLE